MARLLLVALMMLPMIDLCTHKGGSFYWLFRS